MGSLGLFAQRMSEAGFVFNIEFTEDELREHQRWSLFDNKIMDGISRLPVELELPPRPPGTPSSANTTLWSIMKCYSQPQRKNPGRRLIFINPPPHPITPSMYTLELLIQNFAIDNPISSPDDVPLPHHLIIIGGYLLITLTGWPHF